jgi:hypothetical protein
LEHAFRFLSGDQRLLRRYKQVVSSHLQASQALASGIHSIPDTKTAFAATLGAHRFLNNPRVSLPALAEPLLAAARLEAVQACDHYGLVVHDWCQVKFRNQESKKDRVPLGRNDGPKGYELQSALLVSDRTGSPLAPLVVSLRSEKGVYCSRTMTLRTALSPLDELDPAMSYIEEQSLGRPLVHIIDAQADSLDHYRQWSSRPERYFLVRIRDRIVEWAGQEQRVSAIRATLRQQGALRFSRTVLFHGVKAYQWVAESVVRLTRPAQRNRKKTKDRRRIYGPPLELRLVISEVRDADGNVLAVWYLLTNLRSKADSATIALWYYWRWSIESYFKLLKSAGMNLESWQQQTVAAIARRLLVASMACVTVWRLSRSTHPRAERAREVLVRLSGRQMKHGRKFTLPALLAGLWSLLVMLEVLETYPISELHEFAALCLPFRSRPP